MNMKESWKPVSISGLTGILMGAGAMFAAEQVDKGSETLSSDAESKGLNEITVDDSLSFAEAFQTARTEIGAGGVFHWRGHIFNTYTAEEWTAMSNEDKKLFAQQVKPEVSPADIDTHQLAESSSADVTVAEASADDDVQIVQTAADDQTDNDDVRVIGFGDVDLPNGQSITVQELEVNGRRVAIVDIDQDGQPDLAMSDLNGNHQMDEGEVIDLHSGEVITFHDQASIDDVDTSIDLITI